jgi:hypothetical protein
MLQSSRTRPWKRGLLVSSVSALLSIAVIELVLHALLEPSEGSSGTLLGHELPPLRVIPSTPPTEVDRSEPHDDLIVDGVQITVGDLNGAYKEDESAGHVPLENWSSANGWWKNDASGARMASDVAAAQSEPKSKMLIFGDSFAVGFGLRQQEVWSSVLQAEHSETKFYNFGVPGYGMGQSYLRYQQLRGSLQHDAAILVFVPGADLWRDVNVVRNVGEEGWISYNVLPRFVVEDHRLRLISSPYRSSAEVYADNSKGLSDKLRQHLLEYDRFYFPGKYEQSGPWSSSTILRMFVKIKYDKKRTQLHKELVRSDSEANLVSRALFERMDGQVREAGGKFVLVILPSHRDLSLLKNDDGYRRAWEGMTNSLRENSYACIDLTADFMSAAPEQLDRAHDGSHFGPMANLALAAALGAQLEKLGLVAANH